MEIHQVSIKVSTAWSAPMSVEKLLERYVIFDIEGLIANARIEFIDKMGDLIEESVALEQLEIIARQTYTSENQEASALDYQIENKEELDNIKEEVSMLKEQLSALMQNESQDNADQKSSVKMIKRIEAQVKKLNRLESKWDGTYN